MPTMMNVGVADCQIFGQLCVLAEMLRVHWVVTSFRGRPTIRVATVAPDAAGCAVEGAAATACPTLSTIDSFQRVRKPDS